MDISKFFLCIYAKRLTEHKSIHSLSLSLSIFLTHTHRHTHTLTHTEGRTNTHTYSRFAHFLSFYILSIFFNSFNGINREANFYIFFPDFLPWSNGQTCKVMSESFFFERKNESFVWIKFKENVKKKSMGISGIILRARSKKSSIKYVTVLRGVGKGFCDHSTKDSVIKSVTMGGWVSKNVQNMDDP